MNVCPECGMGPRGIEDDVCQNCDYDGSREAIHRSIADNSRNAIEKRRREAEREHQEELTQQALAANELRARLPHIVRDAIAEILEEADDLEHARELAGLDRDSESWAEKGDKSDR